LKHNAWVSGNRGKNAQHDTKVILSITLHYSNSSVALSSESCHQRIHDSQMLTLCLDLLRRIRCRG